MVNRKIQTHSITQRSVLRFVPCMQGPTLLDGQWKHTWLPRPAISIHHFLSWFLRPDRPRSGLAPCPRSLTARQSVIWRRPANILVSVNKLHPTFDTGATSKPSQALIIYNSGLSLLEEHPRRLHTERPRLGIEHWSTLKPRHYFDCFGYSGLYWLILLLLLKIFSLGHVSLQLLSDKPL